MTSASDDLQNLFSSDASCNALFIYLIILVEFRVFYMTYMIYVDK